MADAPIGISFIPSAQNQADGPANLRASGGVGQGGTDLSQAYKILSLRLPTVVGASAPADPSLLNSAGAAGVQDLPGGLSPYAAMFLAMLKAHLGGDLPSGAPGNASPDLSAFFGGGPNVPISPSSASQASTAPPTDSLAGLFGAGGGGGEAGAASSGRAVPKITFPGGGSASTPDPASPPAAQSPYVPQNPSGFNMNYY